MNDSKHSGMGRGQMCVLAAALLPMAAIGVAGAVATYVNMNSILHREASALGLVAAGEGATLVCALVALAVTLMGQHTPATVRLGMWLAPVAAGATGVALARNADERVYMGITPLAMTAAGEGAAFVARRVVAYRTNTDLEQQRRSGLLLWHANRAVRGGWVGKRLSRAAVWRLSKQFAATDAQLAVQLVNVQRFHVSENANANLAAVLSGSSQRPAVTSAPPVPTLPPATPSKAPQATPEPVQDDAADDHWDFVRGVLNEAEANVLANPTPKLLTVAEVAELKGVQPATVRAWKHRGRLRVHDTVDGSPRFHPDDVANVGV